MLALGIIAAPKPASAQRTIVQPEAASGWSGKRLAVAERHMVAAANPLAAEAGRAILRRGGSAIDAAIAVQFVLGLVEPQSSGLGGGAFLMHWDAASGQISTYDGRETAPSAARPDRFLVEGRPMPFDIAVHSGLAIGTPGLVRLMGHVHARHGRLPWQDLLAPAIALARSGFAVSPRLNALLAQMGPARFAATARSAFFSVNGSAWPVGHVLIAPAYAATLQTLARAGADAFYTGAIAEEIVAAARRAPNHAGDLTAADLAGYAVRERQPVCIAYRGRRVCGMGPPSSGAIAVAQTLALLEPFDLGREPGSAMNPRALHLIAEALKLAYADRDRFIADPDHVAVPEGLLDADYLARRRDLIDPARAATTRPRAGEPRGAAAQRTGLDATEESVGTTHVSIIDADGNAVSLTSTIEAAFGSRVMAAGFLLNNQMTDFSRLPVDAAGRPIANRVAPGKRPRSSMAPTLVFDVEGKLEAVIGSPGGSRIIPYVVKTLIAMIDWGLDPQAAVSLANFGSRGGAFEIELDRAALWNALKVKPFGHIVRADAMTSGLHVVARRNGRLEGGADPRREGVALGD